MYSRQRSNYNPVSRERFVLVPRHGLIRVFINPSLSSRAKVSTDGKAQGYERREEFVRRGDVRACVNTQAEMEGREEIGGRAHECVSLSSVHTLCHCGALPLTLSPVVFSRLKSARFRRVRFRNRAPSPKRDATRGGRRGRIVTPLCARNRAAKIDERGWRSEAESFGREENPVDNHNTRFICLCGGCTIPGFSSITVRRKGKYAPGNTSISGNIMARFTNNYTGDVGPPLFARYSLFSLPCSFQRIHTPFSDTLAFDIYYPCIRYKTYSPRIFRYLIPDK